MITEKKFNEIVFETERQGKKISFKTGKLAPHCDGAVEITMEGTILLVTAVMEKKPKPDNSFFPLAIDYRESFYAAGKIGGGRYRKREGRPSDESVLYCRLTDRPLRPMFPKGMINDVIITISPLQLDMQHSPGELCIIGASAAIMLAGIPFEGPLGAIRIGYIDGKYVMNMTNDQAKNSILDLHVAGTKDKINMLEAEGNETPMDIIKWGLQVAQKAITELCDIQEQFLKKCTINKKEYKKNFPSDSFIAAVKKVIPEEKMKALHGDMEKNDWEAIYATYAEEVKAALKEQIADPANEWSEGRISEGFFMAVKEWAREHTLKNKSRIDGRSLDQIRQIYCELDTIPRAHGTWLFRRGDTQVLSILTLGAPGDAELIDDMENDNVENRWMHHYKMPPFSNNEAQMIRWTNRREVGHGRLAEKAIEKILPDEVAFPYTMRVVSEVLGSWGSTSMASVCATTLALMAGGVPIKKPISGIAMGLMTDENEYAILTDIMWTEDFTGDMDFKLAGTDEGMTAIQMDTKLKGAKVALLEEMLDHAQAGRSQILAYMLKTIAAPRAELSQYAPALLQFEVKPDEVRVVIGPGGATIQDIVRQTGAQIDIEDDGKGVITAKDLVGAQAALAMIKAATRSPSKGDQLEGKITRVEKYGVFVDMGKKKQWLVHVKQLGEGYIEDVSTMYKIGDMMKVEVTEIDREGKIQLKKM